MLFQRPTFLATALALGLLAGCSSNTRTSPPETRPAESGGTPAPTMDTPNSKTGPSLPQGDSGGTADSKTVVYYVKDSGVRCITTPCPSFIAIRADRPDEDGIQITEMDLAALGVDDEQRAKLLESTHDGSRGLKVEATIVKVPNAGPAGDGTRLSVNRVLEGK